MSAATQVQLKPGENRFRILPEPKTRVRPTDEELRQKLVTCREQYAAQVVRKDDHDSQMITLGQIAALLMILGETDPNLPLICVI